jgi:shikimate kinase
LEGKAYCHGAATIINGIPLGLGAAFGIDLKTEASVTLTDEPSVFDVTIESDEKEDTKLAERCVYLVLKRFGFEEEYGARIKTRSDIPISRGLKSSSSASNAIVLAAFRALGRDYSDMEVINLGIEASIFSKVTLTGAFDDACATYFGDVVVTDNLGREILKRYKIEEDLEVIVYVPEKKIRKSEVDIQKLKGIKYTLKNAHNLALSGDFKEAMRINGFSYGEAMGLDCEIMEKALENGAECAGISGTGPATVILVKSERKEEIISALGDSERIIQTKLNSTKAGQLD